MGPRHVVGNDLGRALLLAVGVGAGSTVQASSTLRCEGGVVRLGDEQAVVAQVCGPPATSSIRSQERVFTNRIGISFERIVDVETWIYDRGPGRFMQILDFAGGVLVSIERGRRSSE